MLDKKTKELLIGVFKDSGFEFDHIDEAKKVDNIVTHIMEFKINKQWITFRIAVSINEAPAGFTVLQAEVYSDQLMWNVEDLELKERYKLLSVINSLNSQSKGSSWVCVLNLDKDDKGLAKLNVIKRFSFSSGLSIKNKYELGYHLAHLNEMLDAVPAKFNIIDLLAV